MDDLVVKTKMFLNGEIPLPTYEKDDTKIEVPVVSSTASPPEITDDECKSRGYVKRMIM